VDNADRPDEDQAAPLLTVRRRRGRGRGRGRARLQLDPLEPRSYRASMLPLSTAVIELSDDEGDEEGAPPLGRSGEASADAEGSAASNALAVLERQRAHLRSIVGGRYVPAPLDDDDSSSSASGASTVPSDDEGEGQQQEQQQDEHEGEDARSLSATHAHHPRTTAAESSGSGSGAAAAAAAAESDAGASTQGAETDRRRRSGFKRRRREGQRLQDTWLNLQALPAPQDRRRRPDAAAAAAASAATTAPAPAAAANTAPTSRAAATTGSGRSGAAAAAAAAPRSVRDGKCWAVVGRGARGELLRCGRVASPICKHVYCSTVHRARKHRKSLGTLWVGPESESDAEEEEEEKEDKESDADGSGSGSGSDSIRGADSSKLVARKGGKTRAPASSAVFSLSGHSGGKRSDGKHAHRSRAEAEQTSEEDSDDSDESGVEFVGVRRKPGRPKKAPLESSSGPSLSSAARSGGATTGAAVQHRGSDSGATLKLRSLETLWDAADKAEQQQRRLSSDAGPSAPSGKGQKRRHRDV
jgi:hypothetical protein